MEENEQIADDLGLDYGTNATPSIKRHFVKDDKFFYALNIKDKKKLANGFRFIKELLLQHHIFFS